MRSVKQVSEIWNVSERRVAFLCKSGKIPGAVKDGRSWEIPDDAEKPFDGRVRSGRYIKTEEAAKKKPLPVGVSDFVRAQSEYYYVDKTLLIRDFLDRKTMVTLFTRPRRFGKTINMDMLRVFFERSEDDTAGYFKNKKIWKFGTKYTEHQGKYPVVFWSFKDVKFDSWEASLAKIAELLQEEFGRHSELKESDRIADYERSYFNKVMDGSASEVELSASLQKLSKMLYEHHGRGAVIIIDEYDTPIQEGHSADYYDKIINFMRNFFSGAFKDNRYLAYGFLTGILRIAQESIFSGLNNLTVNSIMDNDYDEYFGFTDTEVLEMLRYYGGMENINELTSWYNGYIFGRKNIYNPWSVINYIAKGFLPQAYWVNTGRNEILEDVLNVATDDIIEKLHDLMQGNHVVAKIDQNVVYRTLTNDPSNIYSLLLVAGYLKTNKKELMIDGSWLCEVSIPDREIASVYSSEILSYMMNIGALSRSTANKIAESLYSLDFDKLQISITEYMRSSVSYYDSGSESFYHGLVLGLIALTDSRYNIRSNRESGYGRYDICLIPHKEKYPGIIMEFKYAKDLGSEELEKLSEEALKQIDIKRYDAELADIGITSIMKLGIAFSGKSVAVSADRRI